MTRDSFLSTTIFSTTKFCLAVIVLSFSAISCVKTISAPENLEASRQEAEEAWARVLLNNVDTRGRVNFVAVKNNPQDLELYVSFIARANAESNPEIFKDPKERLAHMINAYNALAMYGVIKEDIPADLKSAAARTRFFYLNEYLIGGEEMSLYTYENDVIRKEGDPRIHFAVNCMSVGCPRLPQIPFEGSKLDAQLDEETKDFFNDPKYVMLKDGEKTALLSEILSFYTEDFVNDKVAPSLLSYVNRYRNSKVNEEYKVSFIQYDWTINSYQ